MQRERRAGLLNILIQELRIYNGVFMASQKFFIVGGVYFAKAAS
jgi:hypothetical protein